MNVMVVLNDLFERKKIKDYMTMLGIEIPDLRKFGDYKQSDQYLRNRAGILGNLFPR